MATIYHICTAADWSAVQRAGRYEAASLSTEGFIHCSTAAQVASVANLRFRGRRDLVLLHVDEDRVEAEIRYEAGEDAADRFPHVYGALGLDAVVEVSPFEPGSDGRFAGPRTR